MNIKKSLITVGVAICLMIASNKIYNTYKEHQPVAEVGECLQIIDPMYGPIKILVVGNDNINAVSDLVIEVEIIENIKITTPIRVSYQELRESNAVKVSCE